MLIGIILLNFQKERDLFPYFCSKSKFFFKQNNGIRRDTDSITTFLGTESENLCYYKFKHADVKILL